MIRNLPTLLLAFLFATNVCAQTEDNNVMVSDASDCYYFSEKNGVVTVRNERAETYTATRMWADVQPFISYGRGCQLTSSRVRGYSPMYKNVTRSSVFAGDTKVCYFNARLGSKGETLRASFERLYSDVRFFTDIPFHNDYFIKDKVIKVVVPKSLSRFAVKGINLPPSVVFEHKQSGGNDIYTFTITNMPTPPTDDNQPDNTSGIIVTGSFADYADLYAWEHKFAEEVDCSVSNIDQIVSEATAGANSDVERVARTLEWVQNNIRYVAVEKGDNAWKPDAPQEVIRKRYGDCKGMALLLRTLLKHQKIDARLADVSSAKAFVKPSQVPTLCSIDHMVCVAFVGGKEYWLDATNKYAPLGFVSDWTSGCEAIYEEPGNKCRMVRMPLHTSSMSKDSVVADYSFAPEGAIVGEIKHHFTGDMKMSALAAYFETESQDRKELSGRMLGVAVSPNIDVSDISWSGADSRSDVSTLSAKIRNKDAVEMVGSEVYVELNPMKDWILPVVNTEKRKTDYELPMIAECSADITLSVPKSMTVESVPENLTVETDNAVLSLLCEARGQKIIFRKKIVIKNKIVPLAKQSDWNATVKRWNEACSEQIVLKKCNQ